jgi:hypothetical protein
VCSSGIHIAVGISAMWTICVIVVITHVSIRLGNS